MSKKISVLDGELEPRAIEFRAAGRRWKLENLGVNGRFGLFEWRGGTYAKNGETQAERWRLHRTLTVDSEHAIETAVFSLFFACYEYTDVAGEYHRAIESMLKALGAE